MTGKRIRVAVLFGGVSSEHEVSLMSVESVLANLPQEYEVLRIGITKDGRWVEYTGKNDEITSGAWEQDKSLRTAVLSPDRSHKGFLLLGSDGWELAPVDICFPVLHGKHGEDGTIQSLLEFLGIPFVGSPASVCHRAWNKDALHSSLAKYRDLTGEEGCASWPQGVYLARDAFKGMGAATALDMVADRVIGGYPVCVKPAHGGSALGVHKVKSQEELGEAVLDALCTETLLEFPCEGVVWWTLIRLDKIWDYNPSLAERRALNPNILLWPISASARNKNTKLTQTEGWN